MRIVHTSDWHLGRSFGDVSLAHDQAAFADWFVELVSVESCELVVIAGDIYDRAVAPTSAIDLFRDTLRRLLGTGATVVVITGNHDGADRVAAYSELLDLSGLILRGGYDGVGEVIRREFSDGPLDLVLLPFLDPQVAPDSFGVADGAAGADTADGTDVAELLDRRRRRTHESVLQDAVDLVRPHLTAPRSVAVAHAFVAGGAESESERQLTVGGTGQVAADVFDGFSYTALGHLHRPQHVGVPEIRYSGTPLPYSFSEDHPKSVTIVELAADGSCDVNEVRVPVGRSAVTIEGPIDDLLRPDSHPEAHDAFVRATVTDRETVLEAKARLQAVYPHIVEVRLQPTRVEGEAEASAPDLREVTPFDAVLQFWEAAEGAPPDDAMSELLREVVEVCVRRVES